MYRRIVAKAWLLIGPLSVALALATSFARADQPKAEWKAGTATVAITPEEPMWMAGYASRDKPSEGKIHDLCAKALAFEDAEGARLVILTVDLVSVPRPLRDA